MTAALPPLNATHTVPRCANGGAAIGVLEPRQRVGDAPAQLLLIDDEASIREPLTDYLVGQGFAVDGAADAGAGRAMIGTKSYDLVICDIMMPGEDGLSLTRFIREGPGLPVILLTARAEETERIIGLEIGADDYVVKPFSPRELVARIRAVLRRAHSAALPCEDGEESYRFGDWQLSTTARSLRHSDSRDVALSSGEYQLLLALLANPRRVMTRDQLLDLVRGRDAEIFDRSIDNLISRLRRKIEDDARAPTIIKTIWGGGYMISTEVVRSGRRG
ncbi:MAG: response regulator [Sphingopyxis sp.]